MSAVLALAAPAPADKVEASREKKRMRKRHREQAEATAASSESPRPPTTPESKRESTVPVAPGTLIAAATAAVGASPQPPANPESKSESPVPVAPETPTSVVKERERHKKNHVAPPASPLLEEPVRKEAKKRKKRKHGEAAGVIPSLLTPAAAQNLQMESKVTAEGATVRKKQRRPKVEQEQSGQPLFPIDVHQEAGEEAAAAAAGVMGSHCVKRSSSKKSRVLNKQQPLPQGILPPTAIPNSIDQDPNYSSPYGAFAQFAYKPDHRKDGNGLPLPNNTDRPAKLPPKGHPSSGSSLLTAKGTSKAARTTTSNTKQPCPASTSTSGSQEVARIKGKEKPENKMTREMAVEESPCPLANPEYKSDSVTPQILSSVEMTPTAVRQVKERERKNQEVLQASPLIEEPVWKEEKKHKKWKNGEAAVVIPSLPTAAVGQILQMESKLAADGVTVRKKHRRRKVEHKQTGQQPFRVDVHPQAGEEAAAAAGVMGSQCVKRSSSKKSRVLKKQHPLPQGFLPPTAVPNSIDLDPNYSSPYGAFAQFAYKPDHRKDGNGLPLPNTADRPAKLPPKGHPSSGSSLLTAKGTSTAARTTTSNTKQPCPASASTSGSQEVARIKGKEKPENKMTREMAVEESPCPLANPEYKSDFPVPVTPQILSSVEMAPMAVRQVKECERKNQEVLQASPLMEEPVWKEEKKHKKWKNGEAAVVIPSPPTAAVAQILQMESKLTADGVTVRKKHRRRKVEHEQTGQQPFSVDVHPHAGEEAAAAAGVMGSQCVKRSSSKKSRVLKKQHPLPQGFFPPTAIPNCIDQDPNYSSPYGAFAQFAYKPDRRQEGNGRPVSNTAYSPARLPPKGHPSSGSSLLTAKGTSKAARTTTSNTKQPCPVLASTSGSQEEARIKGKENPENKMTREMAVKESPRPLANPEYKSDFPVTVTPQILSSVEMTPTAVRQVKERERKNQEVLQASPLIEEPVWKEEKKHKKWKNGEAAVVIPSPPTAAVAQILQMESKLTADGVTVRKKHRRRKVEHEQTGQQPFSVDVHPHAGEEAAAAAGVMGSQCVKRSSSKKSRVLKKQHPLPQGFFPPTAIPNCIDQDPNYSSPYGAFAQFAYKPDRRQEGNGRPVSNTAENMTREKKQRKRSPLLSSAEKRSHKYRRLPLDKLVSPPLSPHGLLQEKYASDPWKVIVICMLLNLTQGIQVRSKVEGFFELYPDPQTAYTADPEKMAEYLAPLGLQRVKTDRIQKFSKAYVGEEWTYITELCGVGKYAADAYAIFCAGRADEVIPQDHKLVHYWRYVRKRRRLERWRWETSSLRCRKLS